MPGVVSTTVDIKMGNVELLTSDKRAGEKSIRETIDKTNFKVVSITGPTKIKR